MLSRISFIALMTLLAACAQTLPVTTEPPANDTPAPSARLHDLEAAAAQLRQQQLAMGESLTWLEGEIKALRHTDFSRASAVSPTALPDAAPTPAEEQSQSGPTQLVPTSSAPVSASVSELSSDDMSVEPTSHTPSQHTAVPTAPASHASGYAVHVASFSRSEQLHRGWQEIKHRYGAQIGNLRPFGTAFTDSQGRNWTRLNVGPLNSRQAANDVCNRLKTAGAFCDVQPVTAGSTRPVQ